ncbi:hypothetical protein [Kineococcus aurantiacus]|uniref:N-acetyltransferase domain-containing protein n=1 Tax=Kineococcus aurantiacus TaxID=37633 RepID=A0A7Y9J0T3_9ACTN|nr:hypothetical protein [Kineococcus aurantiacus]NYD22494.1 hypothetical protein [Kineococcus aurantiacus]
MTDSSPGPAPWRALTAHGDAWQVHGRLRGGAAELPGARLMASGLPRAQWNNADVDDPDAVDVAAVRAWYRHRGVPWGVRVPAGMVWPHGRFLFRKRLLLLERGDFRPQPLPAGLDLAAAGPGDLGTVVALDHAVFGGDPALTAAWCAPLLAAPEADVVLARRDGVPAATGYVLASEGRAGPAALLGGLTGHVPALGTWLLRRAFAAGARFAHTHPGGDAEAPALARLGFAEAAALDVHLHA